MRTKRFAEPVRMSCLLTVLLIAAVVAGCSKSTDPTAPRPSLGAFGSSNVAGMIGHDSHDSTEAEFRGILTAIDGKTLTVDSRPVVTDSQTVFRRGHDRIQLADLVVGDTLRVEGTRQADGSVRAREVTVLVGGDRESRESRFVRLMGLVSDVSLTDHRFKVDQTTVFVDSLTRFGDHRGLADLKVGERVFVLALRQADGSLLARHVNMQGEFGGMGGDEGDDSTHVGDGDHHGEH